MDAFDFLAVLTYDSDPSPYLMGQPNLTFLHTVWSQRTRPRYQQFIHEWWLGQDVARLPNLGAPIQNHLCLAPTLLLRPSTLQAGADIVKQ